MPMELSWHLSDVVVLFVAGMPTIALIGLYLMEMRHDATSR